MSVTRIEPTAAHVMTSGAPRPVQRGFPRTRAMREANVVVSAARARGWCDVLERAEAEVAARVIDRASRVSRDSAARAME